jgi:GntR family transcriptional regulator/MocR family aminotransferase
LKSLDESAQVLYVGSFSKVLFPGVRLGYLVVPPAQVERVSRICQLLYRDRPIFNQAVVADFMIEGHFARHIKRMRTLYEERRAALAEALTESFRGKLLIQLQAGGMHLLARFADFRSDLDLVTRANSGGLAPAAFSPWGMELARAEQGLLLSFTNMPRESAQEMAMRLKAVL